MFAECEVVGGAVAEALFRDGLCLPSGTAMCEEDLARVAELFSALPPADDDFWVEVQEARPGYAQTRSAGAGAL
jgi:hypothetical protein